ncbi:hypothetical protein [Dactylosporangium sp. NPDC005555]|uniref:hypothetical protein n=1 Tax=Dactylosporangium sp. NPDC005555 TaxID=3154889 RepID=UPI0033B2C11A
MLTLTDGQMALLLAMDAGMQMKINRNVVWIRRRPYAMADLYALRAAGLVRSAETPVGMRSAKNFELTDRGVTQAQRLADQHPPTATASPPTLAAQHQPSCHAGTVTC